ncbi:MAG: hypothetical protein HY735_03400 [Verrucomicrobia bacterium]|nr:hypothetical protein [Verrucomicrobiota bacterium]
MNYMGKKSEAWRRLLRYRFHRLVRSAMAWSHPTEQMIGVKRNILMNLLARLRRSQNAKRGPADLEDQARLRRNYSL